MKHLEKIQIAETITNIVFDYYGIDKKHIKSKVRKREIVTCRYIAMYSIRKHMGRFISINEVGSIFDKDHSTVCHGIDTVHNLISYDSSIEADIKILKREIAIEVGSLEKKSKLDVAIDDLKKLCDRLNSGNVSQSKNTLLTIIYFLESNKNNIFE